MPKYISGRYKKTPQSALTADRYRYLSVGDAEPNLGDTPTVQGSPDLPVGQQYIVVSFIDRPGERFWIPNQGGIIPGSLSVFEEGTLVGGLSSTTQLNFIGQSITAAGVGTGTNNPGVAVTITVAPPGNLNEVLFVGAGGTDFDTDTRFTFDDGLFTAGDRITVGTGGTVITTTGIGSVGIGTTNPTQKLHLDGNFRITGTIYDSLNQPGSQGDLIVKTATGGLEWVEQQSITAGAGGTIGQIQFHAATGLVNGASNFYYDFNNNRVGIGSTQPTQLLDVLGISNFSGGVFVDNLNVSGITTFKNKVHFLDDDILHFGGAEGDDGDLQIYHDGNHSQIKDSGTGNLQLLTSHLKVLSSDGSQEYLSAESDGPVQLYHDGNKKLETTGYGATVTGGLNVSGISSLGNVEIGSNTISTKEGTGNLIIDSDASVNIKDPLIVSGETESETKDSGSLVVEGGIGVEKSVNIGKNLKVTGVTTLGSTDANTGFTTTVGDLYVGGDLYINDDISFDNLQANTGTFSDSLEVTGITTIHKLYIGAAGTIGITTILDEDDMSSNSDTALATQQSIKAYVDNEIGAIDLDFAGDGSTSGTVDLDSQTFTISGTTNEIETSAENQTLTIGLPDNVTVSGNLTVNGNTTLGNDATVDTVSFSSSISSAFIPSADDTHNIGSTDYRWGTVYATTFNGAFQGTADNADKLTNARTFTLGEGEDDDIISIGKTFDGSADVGFALTLKNVGPGLGTYGGDNKLISLTLDAKGRVTGVTSTSIDFGNANVATADSLSNSRNIAATGDIAWDVDFKGHENVTATATLANTDVSAGDYGSGTQVGTFSVDSKGRLTAASNVNINFADATVDKAGYADNAGVATNLKNGQAYNIPYQSGASETSFITNGSDGQLLQFNDNAAPSWVSAGDISAGIAETANNLANGAAGSIPYQDGPGSTVFLAEPDADNKILGYNNSTNAPVWIDASSVGTDTNTFVGLTDTPADYTDQGGKLVAVNSGADALEFIDASSVGTDTDTFVGLTDTPSTLSDQGNKLVAVNNDGDALVFIDASTAGTDTNTTYDLTGGGTDGSDFGAGTGTIILTDSNADTDTVTITAGTNIKIYGTSTTGFTISAQDTNTDTNTDTFAGLTDTPENYDNQGGKLVAVNSGATGLEFIDAGGVGTDTDTFAGLTDTPENYDNQGGKLVAVNSGATGLEFIDANSVGTDTNTFVGLEDTPSSLIDQENKIVAVNSSADALEFIDANSVGTDTNTFAGLTDTPSTLSDQGNKLVAVNSAGNALEFIDAGGVGTDTNTFVGLTDTPSTLSDQGNKLVAVNSAGNALEFIDAGGVGTDTNTFLGLTDTPATYDNKAGKVVQVNSAGDGLVFTNPENLSTTGTTYTLPTTGDNNSVTITLTGSDSTTDPVTITAGDGISFSSVTESGFTITSTAVGGSTEPVGTIVAWGGSTTNIPSEYKLCNGASLDRDEYSDLFDALGTIHGSDSNSTFKIPDLRNQFIVGAKGGQGADNDYPGLAPGASAGSANATLIQHQHDNGTLSAANHRHIFPGDDHLSFAAGSTWAGENAGSFDMDADSSSSGDAKYWYTGYSGALNVSGSTGNQGSGDGTNANLPPYYALCFIIKITTSEVSGSGSGGAGFVDKIEEGDTKAEVIDTSTESKFTVEIDATEKFSVDSASTRIHRQDNSLEGGSIVFHRAADDADAFELDVYRSSSSDSDRFRIVDSIAGVERLTVGSAGQIGLGGENYGVPGQVLTSNGSGSAPTWTNSGGGGSGKVAILSDVKTAGTDGGTFDTGAWRNRELNTELDPESFVTLNNNYFELGEGSYRISWSAPAHAVDKHQTRLTYANNTGFSNSSKVYGTSEACFDPILEGNNNIQTRSFGETIITITETTYFKIQHRCQDSKNDSGFGLAPNWQNETIYTQVIIQDLNSGGGSSSSSSSGNNQTWLADYQNVQSETGSSVEWTGIPEDTQRIIIMFHDVSPGSNQDWLVQLGNTSGNYSAGVYDSSSVNQRGDQIRYDTEGFIISVESDSASASGRMVIERSRQDNTRGWVATGQVSHGNGGGQRQFAGSFASSTTTSVFDRIRFTSENGTSRCFDGGRISILCEGPGGGSSSSSGSGSEFVLLDRKSATGTSVEFTGIPANAYEMTLMFEGVSGSTATDFDVQLGTSSGYITSNYNSSSESANGDTSSSSGSSFIIFNGSSPHSYHGSMIINKSSSNSYSQIGQFKKDSISACDCYGSLFSVSGVVDRLKVSISNGNFDTGGLIGLSYKTASSGSGGSGDGFVTGMIMMFSGTTAPTGWVLCDNSAAAQAANAPDLRDKFIVGASTGGNTTYPGLSVGADGGSANAVLVSHDHNVNVGTAGGGGGGFVSDRDSEAVGGNLDTVSIQSAGESATNKNLPPYYALAFIMKT